MIWLGCFAALILSLLPTWAIYGWRKPKVQSPEQDYRMTILVPFRNEASRILPLLKSLENIDYDQDLFDVLFIDDHSDDNGTAMVRQWVGDNPNAELLEAPGGISGKKSCLTLGIEHARGAIILTTDADCVVPAGWLRSMHKYFGDEQTGLVAGLVSPLDSAGLPGQFYAFDMAALTGVSVGSVGNGMPTMCNGANLAFRKSLFLKVNGYDGNLHIPSGDDEFLMHKIHERFPKAVIYNTDPEAVVQTETPGQLADMIQQRVRWTSKWRHQKGRKGKFMAPVLAISYLALLTGWFSLVFNDSGAGWLAGFTFIKIVADYTLIRMVFMRWKKPPNLIYFLMVELLYPVYVLSFSILAFRRQYVWKDRRYKEAIT